MSEPNGNGISRASTWVLGSLLVACVTGSVGWQFMTVVEINGRQQRDEGYRDGYAAAQRDAAVCGK